MFWNLQEHFGRRSKKILATETNSKDPDREFRKPEVNNQKNLVF